MEIKFYSEVRVDKTFEEYVKEKVAKLGKFIFDEGKAEVYIKKEGPLFVSEITIHSRPINVFLKEKAESLNESIEELLNKVKTTLRKTHDKIIDKSHK